MVLYLFNTFKSQCAQIQRYYHNLEMSSRNENIDIWNSRKRVTQTFTLKWMLAKFQHMRTLHAHTHSLR